MDSTGDRAWRAAAGTKRDGPIGTCGEWRAVSAEGETTVTQDEPTNDRAVEPTEAVEPSGAAVPPADLIAVRELALQANPDVVAAMVGGGSVAEIVASLDAARAAYLQVVEREAARSVATTETPTTAPVAPSVPAGGAAPVALDPDLLPPGEKIRRGLAGAQ